MLALRARVLVVQPPRWASAPSLLARHVSSPPCSRRQPIFALHDLARRAFSSSCQLRDSAPSSSSPPPPKSPAKPSEGKKSLLSRFVPADAQDKTKNVSSFRKIVALAKPERKPLGIAIGLLFVSSAVSMSIPFTVGKLIDFFTSTNPQIPLGLSLGQASAVLLLMFTAGGLANAGRAMLMRLSGACYTP
ncbi:hypothetical protein NUW54_g14606 [Trametes sanguinea]|uniref:Uncharacterized protein n=1 Tax=Trametes sanguinea TaxID=158606 RepID=A0ACC1MC23_9APHY|nr:hypothetical protein NUW54_g14606 [Trametes sanguinea]